MSLSPEPLPGSIQPDWRSRQKLRTRHALQAAALQLFAEQGYEQTTIAQIADRADVSPRTFFVHFPTKEDVLFLLTDQGFEDFGSLVAAAPPALSSLSAIEFALIRMQETQPASETAARHEMTKLLVRAAEISPLVRGKRVEYSSQIAAIAVEALGRRRKKPQLGLATITVAEIAMRIFYLSVDEWTTAGPNDLVHIFRSRFDAIREAARDPKQI
jgi:AcrR family transcriptional regulator